MDHASYVAAIREESERFLDALAAAPPEARVPACPDWSAADLAWHLAEVQHQWAQVVGAGLAGDDVVPPERPADDDLRDLGARCGTELLAALADRDPAQECWSWHDDGHSVGWVARRQAHEALIHRVDAEQTAALDVRPPSLPLAVDGVDELLRVMVDGVPAWGAFVPDGSHLLIRCTNAEESWLLALGRFRGTSPTSGTTYDLDAATVIGAGGAQPDASPDAALSGAAWDLDRWLWGRGDLDLLEVEGDAGLVARFREMVVESTQ